MSDYFLYLIPVDAQAMPSPERREWALALMRQLRPDADAIKLYVEAEPEIFHCGGNLETVFCPHCEAEIFEWWIGAINRWSEGDRSDLRVALPCCGRASTLNDLDYLAPQAFGRFAIEVMNGGPDLEPEEFARFSRMLGLPLRVVWRRM